METKIQRLQLPATMLQLHIELRGIRPKVWRRVVVPGKITLIKLHLVVQAAFGWGQLHLHEFVAQDGERYGTSDPDYDVPGEMSSETVRLTTVLRTTRTLDYVYDFGDYWEHRIKIEKILPHDRQMKLPWCMDGAGATPPEDCGGVPGYGEFLRALADPRHEGHDDMVQWIGTDTWDPAAFDPSEVNVRFEAMKL